jgi:hypothetical protein
LGRGSVAVHQQCDSLPVAISLESPPSSPLLQICGEQIVMLFAGAKKVLFAGAKGYGIGD